MKKVLCSIAVALLILSLTGCANKVRPVQSEEKPPQPMAETPLESTGPVESEPVPFSAGNDQFVDSTTDKEDMESSAEPEPQVAPPVTLQPQEPQATIKASVTFVLDSKKGTVESPTPAQTPEPEPAPIPTPPLESEPTEEPALPAASEPSEPEFSIDRWISYAQEYAKTVGLNLDSTAVDCWDNPITAGAHCTCLERDIQSRLNRYARDETILDVWVWTEGRSDGSYDLYIGYA